MKSLVWLGTAVLACFLIATAIAGPLTHKSADYQVLEPIVSENLTIFPVVAATSYSTAAFISLDEGLRSGDVEVTEAGQLRMIRPRPGFPRNGVIIPEPPRRHYSGDQVNSLVLVNHSKRALILLAGEILSGGKQDRIVGKDRIVPPDSEPIDLGVFCIEPGRWQETTSKFAQFDTAMVQPSVRRSAAAEQNQEMVWDNVRSAQKAMAAAAEVSAMPAPAATAITATSSYAKSVAPAAPMIDKVAQPIERSYSSVIHRLRQQHAVGAVVAVNGRIIWADIFASSDLLEKYWPKLVRSYAAEAVTTGYQARDVDEKNAQQFLDDLSGTREISETDPDVFRRVEIDGDGYKAFRLTSLLPQAEFDVHISKMVE